MQLGFMDSRLQSFLKKGMKTAESWAIELC